MTRETGQLWHWPAMGMLLSSLTLLCACPPPPHYDDAIGVSGVASEPGSLAGSWAVHQRQIYLGWVAVLASEVEVGGDQYFLLERSWDDESETYQEQWQLCADLRFETAGLRIEPTEATVRNVAMTAPSPEIEHSTGGFAAADLLQLWALRDLPDPLRTTLPNAENYQQAPQRDWIYDADSDGELATTVLLKGILEGEERYVNRKIVQQRGVVASEHQLIGLIEIRASWAVLDATVALAIHHGEMPSESNRQHPDPKRSWFEQQRLEGVGSCTAVMQASDDGTLSTTRPF